MPQTYKTPNGATILRPADLTIEERMLALIALDNEDDEHAEEFWRNTATHSPEELQGSLNDNLRDYPQYIEAPIELRGINVVLVPDAPKDETLSTEGPYEVTTLQAGQLALKPIPGQVVCFFEPLPDAPLIAAKMARASNLFERLVSATRTAICVMSDDLDEMRQDYKNGYATEENIADKEAEIAELEQLIEEAEGK